MVFIASTHFAPSAEAVPAEHEAAAFVLTSHSDAPRCLFDRPQAFWTLLRVGLKPEVILVIVFLLLQPHIDLLAIARLMLVPFTNTAEGLAALAEDGLSVEMPRHFDEVLAGRRRATHRVRVGVDELAAVPLHVFCPVRKIACILKQIHEPFVRHNQVTVRLQAGREHTVLESGLYHLL